MNRPGIAGALCWLLLGPASDSRAQSLDPALFAEIKRARFDFRWFHVQGDELRIILDTSQSVTTASSHGSSRQNGKGWLICVDLTSDKALRERARVYGPLWEVPNARSSLSHTDGVNFTAADRRAAAVQGFVAFDHLGNVVRTRASGSGQVLELLDLAEGKVRWGTGVKYQPPVGSLAPFSEDEVQTLSHRYRLRRVDQKVTLTETLSGKRLADPWLEATFATYRGMKDMGNVRALLTDDLQFLFCHPADFWNRGGPPMIEKFTWDGKKYERSKWQFYFQRSKTAPEIVPKQPAEGVALVGSAPSQALTIDGDLHLLYLSHAGPVLVSPRSGTRRFGSLPDGVTAPLIPFLVQHDASRGILYFFDSNPIHDPAGIDSRVILLQWNYTGTTMTSTSVPTHQLFENASDQFVPRHAIGIEVP